MRFIYTIIITSVMLAACETDEQRNAESASEGVVVHGCCNVQGWIQNTNPFPVRVKKVWVYGEGESTRWFEMLPPGKKLSEYVADFDRYRIFSISGGEIGWIMPIPNGRPEKRTPASTWPVRHFGRF